MPVSQCVNWVVVCLHTMRGLPHVSGALFHDFGENTDQPLRSLG
jgi:hypothetical protein